MVTATAPTATLPDATGHFGPFGGMFVPETLMAPLQELAAVYAAAKADPAFHAELNDLLHNYCGRPTPLYFAERWTEKLGGAKIYLKREDLNHTGSHKINNALGQALLAQRMGKTRIIAETGAGQHGVATATACALLGLECIVYMGLQDTRRQLPNVQRMELLGARVSPVEAGAGTLKDATSEAIRDWVTNVGDTHYIIGSVVGPAPYPALVRDLQRVIGDEARALMPVDLFRPMGRIILSGRSTPIAVWEPAGEMEAADRDLMTAAWFGFDGGNLSDLDTFRLLTERYPNDAALEFLVYRLSESGPAGHFELREK